MQCLGCGVGLAPEARFCAACGLARPGVKRRGLPWWAWLLMLGGGAILLVPCLGIVAAIAIPSLLRARISANEASAISGLRAHQVAQATYAELSGGAFAAPACLAQPATCLPAGTAAPAQLLTAEQLPGARHGYQFEFHPGTRAASGLTGYAYTARPLVQNSTGRRSFCVDATQPICWVVRSPENGSWALEGACPRDCQAL